LAGRLAVKRLAKRSRAQSLPHVPESVVLDVYGPSWNFPTAAYDGLMNAMLAAIAMNPINNLFIYIPLPTRLLGSSAPLRYLLHFQLPAKGTPSVLARKVPKGLGLMPRESDKSGHL
jgi:hypothetical protein